MINVLVPALSSSNYFKDSLFPKLLTEICGKTMLERLISNLSMISDSRMILVFDQQECAKFHLDLSARLLTDGKCSVFKLKNETQGALCTCLMAIDEINTEEPLIIVNSDQVLDINYDHVIDYFLSSNAEAGVIGFDSVHPRWGYYLADAGEVREVAEKRPLSRSAVAGFYFFKSGRAFVELAEKTILKGSQTNGLFYISAVLNEYILDGGRVLSYKIDNCNYHSFYSPEKIKEYESHLRNKFEGKGCEKV